MIDQLYKKFKATQPWRGVIAAGVVEKVKQEIQVQFPEEAARRQILRRLGGFLDALEKDPLQVLGHPPLGTDDPDAFRYTADPQSSISAIADLDLGRRALVVVMIKVKGAKRVSH